MKSIIEHIKRTLFATDQDLQFEHRMLISSTVIGIFILIISIILSMVFFSSVNAVMAPIIMTMVLSLFYYSFRFRLQYSKLIFPLLFFISISMSYLWIFVVGMNGTIDLFLVNILLLTLIIIKDKHKKYLLLSYLGLITIFFVLELFYPISIFHYASRGHKIIDEYIAIIINSCVAYFLIKIIHENYTIERQKVEEKEIILKELNSTKDKFFSIIAHDLKNPMGNFRNVTELLYNEYDNFDEHERKEYLHSIRNSSRQVYLLLENLLEWSRSQRGLINFNSTTADMCLIVQNCMTILQLSAEKKKIEMVNKIPMATNLNVDINLILAVIRNIISNAIKFTPQNGLIIVGIKDKSNADGMITIFIKDNGIGMKQETIEKIFRIDCSTSGVGTAGETGTGLGLILCKEFVERHNGKIWVESEFGRGSTFFISLPISNQLEIVS